LFVIAFCAGILVAFGKQMQWLSIDINTFWVSFLVFGSLFFTTVNQTILSIFNMLGHRIAFSGFNLATMAGILIIAIIFVKLWGFTAEYWLAGQILSYILVGLLALERLSNILSAKVGNYSINCDLHGENTLDALNFMIPLAISTGLYWIQMQSYRFILDGTSSVVYVGLFVAGYNIAASVISTVENVLAQYFQPQYYRNITNSAVEVQYLAWTRYVGIIFPELVVTLVFVIVMAPFFAKVLLGNGFYAAWTYVIWGGLVETIRAFLGAYHLLAHANMKTRILLPSNIFGAAFMLLAGFYLIPLWHGHGAGFSLVVAGLASLLCLQYSLKREISCNFPWANVIRALSVSLVLPLFLLIFWMIGVNGETTSDLMLIFAFIGGTYCIILIYIYKHCFLPDEHDSKTG
jgi:O-antigen/teichoic acid export membrane protein